MSEHKDKSKASTATIFGWSLAVLVLYILSPGPLENWTGIIGEDFPPWSEFAFDIYYAPLEWLYDNVETVEQFYDWYMPLFY